MIENPIARIPIVLALLLFLAPVISAQGQSTQPATAPAGEVTFKGSLLCNGACLPNPTPAEHLTVLYAIDGTPEVRAAVEKIVADGVPADRSLDADAAVNLMERFSAEVKYYLDPESPALQQPGKPKPAGHYCQPAAAVAVTGVVRDRDGKRWITASRIEPAVLHYPAPLLAPDKPLVKADGQPLLLKVNDTLTIKCVPIPPGKFLMGTPVYMWPYYVEEYPHVVTLTRTIYMAEVPVTQEVYQAVMGANPSTAKDPQLPVQDPRFADIDRFCQLLSERNGGRTVRLPTDAEWEYAARVGTSNPPFPEKYGDQNSTGPDGFKSPLKVRSKHPNAWGLYDMASCWWEITADRAIYNVRHAETDPAYPPPGGSTTRPADAPGRVQRSGRGIVKDNWSLATHEFIGEKGYAGQKFRVVVEEK